jgi:hypothetical protein
MSDVQTRRKFRAAGQPATGPATAARSSMGLTLGAHQERSSSQNQGADQVLKWNFTKWRRFAKLKA